ncbi:MAG: DNA replication/repair protein RecF [Bacillota bacterium]
MSALKSLTLKNFRLYDSLQASFSPLVNIILGDNAQGKTTLLEAIHALALTKSHKTSADKELITHNAPFTVIKGTFKDPSSDTVLEMILSKEGKKVRHNHIEYRRLSDYVGIINIVMFAPEDLNLVKGGPSERRRFFDMEIGQLNRHYVHNLTQYRKLLKERNEQLKIMQRKKEKENPLLDVLSEQLVHYSTRITRDRAKFIDSLKSKVKTIYQALSSEPMDIDIHYSPSAKGDMLSALKKKQAYDLMTGSTSIGPHRDDCGFYYGDIPVMKVASQGQIRTLALSLKLAVVDMIKETRNTAPIVLLDDVFSELDDTRQKNLLKKFDKDSQIFITSTSLDTMHLESLTDYKVFEVTAGKIEGVKTHGSTL